MTNKKEEILSFESLKIGYNVFRHSKMLLPPVSGSAFSGEFIAVIGRNGIGKSTLLRTLTGLQPPLGGIIRIDKTNLLSLSRIDLARVAGYISTEIIRVSNMKVYDLVALGRFPHTNWLGTIDEESHEAIMAALAKTGMDPFAWRYISELSDGERQRAMISRLLAQDTKLLIMDEPTAYLDIPGKFGIMSLMRSLTGEGKTVIFSTHDLGVALNMSDRIWLLLEDGIVEGSPEELLKNGSFNDLFRPLKRAMEKGLLTSGNDDTIPGYLKYFL